MALKDNLFYYRAYAKPEEVYDGDTFRVELDLGFKLKYTTSVRLFGVNTAEMKDKSDIAKLAKAKLQDFIRKNNGKLIIRSHGLDKYGRFLGEVWGDETQPTINKQLITEGLALEYFGVGKKEAFDPSKQTQNDT
jgi:endonuclease YncB( thermonuclease family)